MRAVRIVGLSAGRHQATALVTRIGGQPDARLVVIEDQDPGTGPAGGEVIATMAVDDWHRTPTRSRQPITDRLHWSKPIIEGLEPGTRYRLRIIDEGNGELAEAIVTTAPAADCDRFRLATGSCFDVNTATTTNLRTRRVRLDRPPWPGHQARRTHQEGT